jgi:hypothetical protein
MPGSQEARDEEIGVMRAFKWSVVLTVAIAMSLAPMSATAQDESKQSLGVPGTFVRVASTEDGWVTLGYRLANETVGDEWMLLEVVLALPQGTQETAIKRTDIALVAPGPKVVQVATQAEYQKANFLMALNRRSEITRDPINYVPNNATASRPLNFFGDPSKPGTAAVGRDQVSLTDRFSAAGRLFFHVPGGIQLGTHNLNVVFANSTVKVPFEIMTKEQVKEFEKKLKEAEKEAKKKKKEKEKK